MFNYCILQCIDAARDVLDTELTARAGESYNRAYGVWKIQVKDHYTFLGICPPTPPLNQHFALSWEVCVNICLGRGRWAVCRKRMMIHKGSFFSYDLQGSKHLEFQLVVWISISHNLLARGHCFLICSARCLLVLEDRSGNFSRLPRFLLR